MSTKKTMNENKLLIAVVIGVVICVLAADIFIAGYMKFGYHVVRCGGMPVKIEANPFRTGSASYHLPGDYWPGGAKSQYCCTEQELIKRGLQRSPLDDEKA